MSLVNFFNTEYSVILGEIKKKQVDLKKCTEDALALLKEFKPPTETTPPTEFNALLMEGERGVALVKPFLLALDPKQNRLFSQTLVCLNRLVSQTFFPFSCVEQLTETLELTLVDSLHNADNALRIIQICMGIVLNYPLLTGSNLVRCFSICVSFSSSQGPKGKPISSDIVNAASVTLRQIAMTCVGKLRNNPAPEQTVKVSLYGSTSGKETEVEMNIFEADVYRITNDMAGCILGEKSTFLHLDSLHITHCLEMIESLLGGNAAIFSTDGHSKLNEAIKDNLLPALVKKFGEKDNYSIYLRILRIFKIVFTDYFAAYGTISHVIIELILKDMKEFCTSWQHILCLELVKVFLLEHSDGLSKMLTFDCIKLFHRLLEFMLENLQRYQPNSENIAQDSLSSALSSAPVVLTGDFSRSRLKFFDQLEKTAPFSFSSNYLFQNYLELFTNFIFKLFLQENLAIVEETDSDNKIELCPLVTFRKYVKPTKLSNYVSIPVLLQLVDPFRGILSCLFEKFQFDESGFQLIHGLLYYSMVFGVLYGAEELFTTCYDLVKRNKHEMTRHLLLQFAIYYHNEHALDWYPVLETTLSYPAQTECIFHLVSGMNISTLEAFINGFCLLSFDSNSTDDVESETFRFLLSKSEQIFHAIISKFHSDLYCTVFRAILFHLVSLTYNKDEFVKQESMRYMIRVIDEFCNEFKQASLPTNYQIELVDALGKVLDSSFEDNKIAAYECLQSVLHTLGPVNLSEAWENVIDCITTVHRDDNNSSGSANSSSVALMKQFKVKTCAFECLQIIISDLPFSVPSKHHGSVLGAISKFISQEDDLNMSLTAIEYLWKFCDHLLEVQNVQEWLKGLQLFLGFGCEGRNEIRNASIQSLFRCASSRNPAITSDLWDKIFADIFFQLIEKIHTLQYEESAIYTLQGLSNIVFNMMDYFFTEGSFSTFPDWWERICTKLKTLLLDGSFSEDYYVAVVKAFKSILTGANKCAVKREKISQWNCAYEIWIKMNRESPERHIHQSVLCQYAQCFQYLYPLLSHSELYTLDLVRDALANFHMLLLRPMTVREALNDTEVMSLLQLAVLEQLSKTFDATLLPTSIDLLVLAWSQMSLIPIEVVLLPEISNYKYCTGIALSSHLLKNVLVPILSLCTLAEGTIIESLQNLVQLIKSNLHYSLKRLAIQSLQLIITRLIQEDIPVSNTIYSSLTDTCICVLEQLICDSNPKHIPEYEYFLQFLKELQIFALFPRQFSTTLMKSVCLVSTHLTTHEYLAFQALSLLFYFSNPLKYRKDGLSDWVMQMLLERSKQGIQQYTNHLFIYGSIPMIDVKYREIIAILEGFLQYNFSFDPIQPALRDILIGEKRQKDVYQLAERIMKI